MSYGGEKEAERLHRIHAHIEGKAIVFDEDVSVTNGDSLRVDQTVRIDDSGDWTPVEVSAYVVRGEPEPLDPATVCPTCHHPHLDYDEPCVSCGCTWVLANVNNSA